MGCGSSQPLEGGDVTTAKSRQDKDTDGNPSLAKTTPSAGDDEKPAKGSAGGKQGTTRARRLSYVTAEANGQPSPAAGPNGGTAASAQSASTRARRLSYVTNDPKAQGDPNMVMPGSEGDEEAAASPGIPSAAADMELGEPKERNGMKINVACMSRAGREPGFKKTNQDNCFAFEKYITEDQSLFGAMDGHGPHGHLVSGFVKQHLPIILVNHLTSEKDVRRALTSGFLEVNKTLSSSRIDCEFSGTTAVVSYLKGRTLTTAWVGDSRGVMGREIASGGYEAVELTSDHKPTSPEEKARILRSNGRVERLVDEVGQPMGPFRVWLQYAWIPGLAMSRALGDVLAHQVGVTSEPDHTTMEVQPGDAFIILASDGVWEFISSQEAVDIVGACATVEDGCRQLVDEAYQRWLTEEEGVVDDITAVVVRFIHPDRAAAP